MLCIGSNIPVFVVGRLLQGISAAMVWSVGLALVVDTVGRDQIAQSMGIVRSVKIGFLCPGDSHN
jgi:predicted MFS family arabinose efflux permease